jgi:enoyl-CoA hydratase
MAELVLTEREGPIAVVLLNRPQQLNALSGALMDELVDPLQELDRDDAVRCIVLGGSQRAFAAGADINELAEGTPISLYQNRRIDRWDAIRGIRTPLVAAVSGYCLGGGCELAMACDLIVASESARFGQPEIQLGVMPGAGGTQRLTRAVGKALAMDMILTGRMLTAEEALRAGLVSAVHPRAELRERTLELCATLAAKSALALAQAKVLTNLPLQGDHEEHLAREADVFAMLFSTEDQKEGMGAFLEKRAPRFTGR